MSGEATPASPRPRDEPWIFRTYAGYATPARTNARFKTNLAKGQTGLSVAFDLPTQTGYDSDATMARGEVGRVGVPIGHLGDRSDLEEIRSLAAVITQADRFGASLVKSLRVHADTLRLKRQQRAEELAQKAGTKILFPTLLFIFPAIFVVILGPAAVQIMEMLSKMK